MDVSCGKPALHVGRRAGSSCFLESPAGRMNVRRARGDAAYDPPKYADVPESSSQMTGGSLGSGGTFVVGMGRSGGQPSSPPATTPSSSSRSSRISSRCLSCRFRTKGWGRSVFTSAFLVPLLGGLHPQRMGLRYRLVPGRANRTPRPSIRTTRIAERPFSMPIAFPRYWVGRDDVELIALIDYRIGQAFNARPPRPAPPSSTRCPAAVCRLPAGLGRLRFAGGAMGQHGHTPSRGSQGRCGLEPPRIGAAGSTGWRSSRRVVCTGSVAGSKGVRRQSR